MVSRSIRIATLLLAVLWSGSGRAQVIDLLAIPPVNEADRILPDFTSPAGEGRAGERRPAVPDDDGVASTLMENPSEPTVGPTVVEALEESPGEGLEAAVPEPTPVFTDEEQVGAGLVSEEDLSASVSAFGFEEFVPGGQRIDLWQDSDIGRLETLFAQLNPTIPDLLKERLRAHLVSPASLPANVDATDFTVTRVRALQRLGYFEAALQLLSLPPTLPNNATGLIIELLIETRQIDQLCGLPLTPGVLWHKVNILCQLRAHKRQDAALQVLLFQELYPHEADSDFLLLVKLVQLSEKALPEGYNLSADPLNLLLARELNFPLTWSDLPEITPANQALLLEEDGLTPLARLQLAERAFDEGFGSYRDLVRMQGLQSFSEEDQVNSSARLEKITDQPGSDDALIRALVAQSLYERGPTKILVDAILRHADVTGRHRWAYRLLATVLQNSNLDRSRPSALLARLGLATGRTVQRRGSSPRDGDNFILGRLFEASAETETELFSNRNVFQDRLPRSTAGDVLDDVLDDVLEAVFVDKPGLRASWQRWATSTSPRRRARVLSLLPSLGVMPPEELALPEGDTTVFGVPGRYGEALLEAALVLGENDYFARRDFAGQGTIDPERVRWALRGLSLLSAGDLAEDFSRPRLAALLAPTDE